MPTFAQNSPAQRSATAIGDAVLTFTAFHLEERGFARSWNSKFIEYALHQHAAQPPVRTSTMDNLTDTSWANGIKLSGTAAGLEEL